MLAEPWEIVRLALGAFLTSAGFGGLMTALAATVALRGVRERMRHDAANTEEARRDLLIADTRERWWTLALHLDSQLDRGHSGDREGVLMLVAEMSFAEDLTAEQSRMLHWLTRKARRTQ